MKNPVIKFAGIAIVSVALIYALYRLVAWVEENPTVLLSSDAIQKVMEESASEDNKKAPYMVDDETRLDKVEVGPRTTKTYLTFPNLAVDEIKEDFETQIRAEKLAEFCEEKDIHVAIWRGFTFAFVYRAKDGTEVANVSIDKSTMICPETAGNESSRGKKGEKPPAASEAPASAPVASRADIERALNAAAQELNGLTGQPLGSDFSYVEAEFMGPNLEVAMMVKQNTPAARDIALLRSTSRQLLKDAICGQPATANAIAVGADVNYVFYRFIPVQQEMERVVMNSSNVKCR